jgi:hypothetical protein
VEVESDDVFPVCNQLNKGRGQIGHFPQIIIVVLIQLSEGVVLTEVDAAELVRAEAELSEPIVRTNVESSQLVAAEIKRDE